MINASFKMIFSSTRLLIMTTLMLMMMSTSIVASQQVGLTVQGYAVPYLVNPNGAKAGMNGHGASTIESTIPGSEVTSTSDAVHITLIDPITGAYSLSLEGPFPETIDLEVSFYDSTTDEEYTRDYRSLYHSGTLNLTLVIDPGQNPAVQLQTTAGNPVIASASLSANENLILSWPASLDSDVVKYRVYRRLSSVPVFQQVAELNALTYDTGDQLQGVSGQRVLYTVVAVTAATEESLVDQILENDMPVIVAFQADNTDPLLSTSVQFTDISLGEPNQWSWDFDSDGVIDSTVQNPSHTFDALGKYSITLSIDGPFGQDTRTVVNYIEVHADSDSDGIGDGIDNCSQVANPNQRDTDGDGFGNHCDADLDQSGFVNSLDLGLFKNVFFTDDANADLNDDGIVNSLDLGLLKDLFFKPVGPGAVTP